MQPFKNSLNTNGIAFLIVFIWKIHWNRSFSAIFSYKNTKMAPIADMLLLQSSSTNFTKSVYWLEQVTAVLWETQYIDPWIMPLKSEYLRTNKILTANMRFSRCILSCFYQPGTKQETRTLIEPKQTLNENRETESMRTFCFPVYAYI